MNSSTFQRYESEVIEAMAEESWAQAQPEAEEHDKEVHPIVEVNCDEIEDPGEETCEEEEKNIIDVKYEI